MIFASKAFFIFLPVVLLGYHLVARRSQKYQFLLLASWGFYAFVPPHYWPVIFLLTVIDYFAALGIESATTQAARKRWLTASVVANLSLLFLFKYTPFVYDNTRLALSILGHDWPTRAWDVVLPLGISFHTFQGISYTIDVYRRHIPAVHSFRDYALFVSFFPQLAAGPVVRAIDFLPQMVVPPAVTRGMVAQGILLFSCGLAKKLLVADHLETLFVGPVFAEPENYDSVTHRLAAVAWAVQIYCDFSGYTDMALGSALLFGFHLPANFRYPYLAVSITDFWRRWHLSLSTWLRDYVYFPMGGSRHSALRTYFNLMVLFVLCGVWHDATWSWLVYGVYNGVLMCLHRAYDRAVTGHPAMDAVRASLPWAVLAWAATSFQFLVGLVVIRQSSWAGGGLMLESLLGLADHTGTRHCPPLVPLLIALGMAGHLVHLARLDRIRTPEWAQMLFAATLLVACLVFAPGVVKTFIYIKH